MTPSAERRERVVALFADGQSIGQVAAAVGVHKASVSRWMAKWRLAINEVRDIHCQACGALMVQAWRRSAAPLTTLCQRCAPRRTQFLTAQRGFLRCQHCGAAVRNTVTDGRYGTFCHKDDCQAAYMRHRVGSNPEYGRYQRAYQRWVNRGRHDGVPKPHLVAGELQADPRLLDETYSHRPTKLSAKQQHDVREYRWLLGWTVQEIADLVGVSKATISRLTGPGTPMPEGRGQWTEWGDERHGQVWPKG